MDFLLRIQLRMTSRMVMSSLLVGAVFSIVRFYSDMNSYVNAWEGDPINFSGLPSSFNVYSLRGVQGNSRFARTVSFELIPSSKYLREKPQGESRGNTMELQKTKFEPEDKLRIYSEVDSSDMPDSTDKMELRIWPKHESDEDCEPLDDWQHLSFPNCNMMHEVNIGEHFQKDLSFLSSKGYWRDVLLYNESLPLQESSLTVWKTLKISRDMEEAFFENNRVDALAMERLTASPHVMDIHGYCGMSVVTGYAPTDISKAVRGLNSTEKLKLGLKVAEGMKDVHNMGDHGRPSLVHNDLNLANVVVTEDNRPVLNDFNVAVLLMRNNKTGETCPFSSRFPNSQWKAPEEQVLEEDDPADNPPIVSEKIDIYALGNVFFRLAVDHSPWKEPNTVRLTPEEKNNVAKKKRVQGAFPPVPDSVRQSKDPAVQVILKAMEMCYGYNPQERPSASELVQFLNDSIADLEDRSRNQTRVDTGGS